MSQARVLYHLLRADFLERVRRYGFLVTLALAVWLGYAVGAGQIKLWVGGVRGVYNSAWVGALIALVANFFLSLAGFYVVKNSVERDRQTGVGQILATTPMSKVLYTLGKTASNFAVLLAMVGVLAVAGVAAQLVAGEEMRIAPWDLLSPLLIVTLPVLALAAATAVLFETIRFLRGGFGNVAWFFSWTTVVSITAMVKGRWDFMGLTLFEAQMRQKAEAALGTIGDGFVLGTLRGESEARVFRWDGLDWTADLLLGRFLWLGVAVGIALLAAVFFDRFDPAGAEMPRVSVPGVPESEVGAPGGISPRVSTLGYPNDAPGGRGLTPLPAGARRFGFFALLKAELRLLLQGQRWWWYAGALGLIIAGFVAPLEGARKFVLPFAWIWPILLWSSLGNREARHATSELVFSAAWPIRRQLPATWAAGVLLAVVTGIGVGVRLAVAGDWPALGAWAVGAAFIPTLALAMGVWSGTSRPFEAVYLALWYIGPLQRVPALDFMGAVPEGAKLGVPVAYLVATVALGIAAVAGRRRWFGVG
ncbi:MAG TPA: ABC transporter permease [Thermoanaerobaculia bacterium]|nr:ABC transporter permease [Thermoanaerobaculia bacterium]